MSGDDTRAVGAGARECLRCRWREAQARRPPTKRFWRYCERVLKRTVMKSLSLAVLLALLQCASALGQATPPPDSAQAELEESIRSLLAEQKVGLDTLESDLATAETRAADFR